MNHLAQTSALLVLGGGGYAYLKAGSKASLVGSLATSSILLGANYLMTKTDYVFTGCMLGVAGGASLVGVGYSRWGKGKSCNVPAALLTIGALNCAYYAMKAWEWKP